MTNMEETVDTTLLLIKLCIDLLCPPLKSGHLVGFGLFLHLLSTFSKFFGTKVLNRNTNDIKSQKKKKIKSTSCPLSVFIPHTSVPPGLWHHASFPMCPAHVAFWPAADSSEQKSVLGLQFGCWSSESWI